MASLPHISVAGAIATGTRGLRQAGEGPRQAMVRALEMVQADGELIAVGRGVPTSMVQS